MEWKGCHSGLYTDVRVAMIHERSRQVEKFPNCRETTWPRTIPTPTFGLAFACPFPGFGHSDHLLPFPRLVESFAAVDLGAAEKVERPMGYGAQSQPHATAHCQGALYMGSNKMEQSYWPRGVNRTEGPFIDGPRP